MFTHEITHYGPKDSAMQQREHNQMEALLAHYIGNEVNLHGVKCKECWKSCTIICMTNKPSIDAQS